MKSVYTYMKYSYMRVGSSVDIAIRSEGGNIELLLIVGITIVVAGRSGCCHGWNTIIVTIQLKISFLLSLLARFYLMLAALVILDNENSVTGWSIYQCCLNIFHNLYTRKH